MRARLIATALCVGVVILGCHQSTTSPNLTNTKPSANDIQLLAPSLQFVPCGRSVCIAWQLDTPVPSARVALDVSFYDVDVRQPAHRSGRRIPAEIEAEQWNLLSTHRLGEDLSGNGSCTWSVPDLTCDQAVLTFTVSGAVQGNDTLVRNFFIGEVRAPGQHRTPEEIE